MAVDGRCQVPRARWMSAVEEAPAASEYTKMGGCVGLRLSRVTWSYVLAFGGTSLQNLHSAFSIWPMDTGVPALRTGPSTAQLAGHLLHRTTRSATLSTQIPFCCSIPATFSGLAQTDLRPGLPRTTQVPIQSPGLAVKAKAAAATPSGPRDVKHRNSATRGAHPSTEAARPTIQATDATRSTLGLGRPASLVPMTKTRSDRQTLK